MIVFQFFVNKKKHIPHVAATRPSGLYILDLVDLLVNIIRWSLEQLRWCSVCDLQIKIG
jgi:hypothetical protein